MTFGMLMQGCAKEDNVVDSELISVARETRGGDKGNRPGGPRGGGGQNCGEVCGLDADVVYQWIELMLEIERDARGMRPNASERSFAYIYLAS